jgi:DNA-binding response OmpR family regulator
MHKAKILIVEDEKDIAQVVKSYLEREGFFAEIAVNGVDALRLLKNSFDLIILDLMLPDMDGREICSSIREFSNIPIIMLTARSSEDDRVNGLGAGADDYVIKPFSPRELIARVKAHLRRSGTSKYSEMSFNNGVLKIHPDSLTITKSGNTIQLTATEFRILQKLAQRPETVFSRLHLVNTVQGYDFEGYDRVIDAHIKNIRHKIEDIPQHPEFIKTVYGAGYKFSGIADK